MNMLNLLRVISFAAVLCATTAFAERRTYYYGDDSSTVRASPKSPWGETMLSEDRESKSSRNPFWLATLLYVPNRIMDFVDIFRVDVGIGPSIGGVIHATEYGQVGARFMIPKSVRFGLFGRRSPLLIESSNEYGIGPAYVTSKDRQGCRGQVGLGVDALVAGVNAGICVEEVLDFLAGFIFIDVMKDDA